MSAHRFSSLRSALAKCALAALIGVPIACARGSTETDIGVSYGGAGGTSTTTTTTSNTVGTGGQTTTGTTSTTGTTTTSTTSTTTGTTSTTTGTTSTTTGTTSTTTGTTSTTTSTTTTSTTTSTSTTASGGSACDNKNNCDSCAACADQSVCLLLGNECYADLFCGDVFNCAWACTSSLCIDTCILIWGDDIAQALFTPYYNCLLCSCENDCGVTGCP